MHRMKKYIVFLLAFLLAVSPLTPIVATATQENPPKIEAVDSLVNGGFEESIFDTPWS